MQAGCRAPCKKELSFEGRCLSFRMSRIAIGYSRSGRFLGIEGWLWTLVEERVTGSLSEEDWTFAAGTARCLVRVGGLKWVQLRLSGGTGQDGAGCGGCEVSAARVLVGSL